jgi:hypothetical protein
VRGVFWTGYVDISILGYDININYRILSITTWVCRLKKKRKTCRSANDTALLSVVPQTLRRAAISSLTIINGVRSNEPQDYTT